MISEHIFLNALRCLDPGRYGTGSNLFSCESVTSHYGIIAALRANAARTFSFRSLGKQGKRQENVLSSGALSRKSPSENGRKRHEQRYLWCIRSTPLVVANQ